MCVCVLRTCTACLDCADAVMCLLIERGWGQHRASWDVVHRACQLLSLSQPPPSPHPILPCSDRPCKTKTAAATAAASKGTISPPVFNLCYSFFPHLSLSCTVLCLSLSLFPPSSSSRTLSSKHFWLFCFPALQRVIAHDNDHGRLFSLHSPASVCTPG